MSNIWDAYERERHEMTCLCNYNDGWCLSCKENHEKPKKPWQQEEREAGDEVAFELFRLDELKKNRMRFEVALDLWEAMSEDEKLVWRDRGARHCFEARLHGWEALGTTSREMKEMYCRLSNAVDVANEERAKLRAATAAAASAAEASSSNQGGE